MPELTPETMLSQAVEARHLLLIGRRSVSLQFGERRVEYTSANLADLDAYIATLRAQIAQASGASRRSRIRYVVPR